MSQFDGAKRNGLPPGSAHSPKDNVAVVVVENLKAGTEAMIVVTENNTSLTTT